MYKAANYLLFAWVLILSGCATGNMNMIIPTREVIDIPTLNAVHSAEIGETIISKGILYTLDAIILRNEVVGGDGFIHARITVRPQTLIATSEDDNWIFYKGDTTTLGMRLPGGGLLVSKSNNKVIKVWWEGSMFKEGTEPSPSPIVTLTKSEVEKEPWYKRELIYNGRNKDTVKFLYRESRRSVVRPGFSQEAQYDLSESRIIGFKGARVEIIDATNTNLTYRVLQSFPDE